ncbi:hypothetical protein ASPCADRAFT_1079 [Aspergillus carbonarius ITEM 5010]|uniref:Uncharacterized protein n=1 Tax=Aspergillus carbonarius (strain ITEM 5010) TaxID=602072 RepID=A0A1R3RY32_ASPC5|nr:hypothetical protein ASPCADRAFT_1079 [Aspergillus carbonarius ITEM 5010]
MTTYEVEEDEYAEIHDIIAATELSDRAFPDRKLDPAQPTLKVKTDSMMHITALLEYLAGNIGATIVSVDAEDLYDRAWDFNEQERKLHRKQNMSPEPPAIQRLLNPSTAIRILW